MEVVFLGAGTVKLVGKQLTIICDPTAASAKGKSLARVNVVTASTDDGPTIDGLMVLDSPGEYEVGGAMITGVGARRHTDESGEAVTVYSIQLDGVNVVVTGPVAADLSADQLERLGKVDVLVIPVGGHGLTLEPVEAASLVQKLEPGYVVPVHYHDGVSEYAVPQAPVDDFLKEMGVTPEPTTKLRVLAREIPEETQVVVLTPAV